MFYSVRVSVCVCTKLKKLLIRTDVTSCEIYVTVNPKSHQIGDL